MKSYYPSNPRHDKAAFILASYAPDTVEDIISLVLSRGSALVNDLNGADGPPRPNAIFSRKYINDLDFKPMYVGALTVQLANLRQVSNDFDFYQKALEDAYGIPSEMSKVLAKKIETYDILGGLAEDDKRAWYSKLSDRVQETIRQSVNYIPSILQIPIENDQSQQYDIDRLYEFKLLGEAVADLNARARLMTAQAAIAQTMGLFRTAVSKKEESGDIEDGDADLGYQEIVADTFRPLMGAPIPGQLFGGFAAVANIGKAASTAKAQSVISDAGLSRKAHEAGRVRNPNLRSALNKVLSIKPGKLAGLAAGVAFAPAAIKIIKNLAMQQKGTAAMGDIMGDIADKFGDDFASSVATGDVEGMLTHISDLSGDMETTGDPELDEEIIGDVMDEIQAEGGDIEAGDIEVGGLFKRMRINAAIRRGNRRGRRMKRKMRRQGRKDRDNDSLNDARDYAGRQTMSYDNDNSDRGGDDDQGDSQDQDSGSSDDGGFEYVD